MNVLRVCLCFSVVFVSFSTAQVPHRKRYEFKYSFKGPGLLQADKTIPFWNHTGDAVPGEEQVRVVPSLRGKTGGVWSKYKFPYNQWEVELHFRIHGRGKVGADGLVIWLVEEPNQPGSVFGYKDQWKGMGLFFDSFDNDNLKNNPYIYTIVNDGTISYSHATDGNEQKNGGCLRDFRNRPYPVKARITYINQVLLVEVDSGNTDVADYETCFRVENLFIPKDFYFGITAATGGLADDHDVLKFLVSSLHDKKDEPEPEKETESDEKLKLQREYEKSLMEFEKEQQEFKEKHPDLAKTDQYQAEELFEGGTSQELRAIFDIQSSIKKQMGQLLEMMHSIDMKQSDISDKVTAKQGTPGTGTPDPNAATAHDVRNLHDSQKMTIDLIENIRADVTFIRSTLLSVSQSISQISIPTGGTGGGGGGQGAYDNVKQLRALHEQMDGVQSHLVKIQNKQNNPPPISCPQPDMPSCVPLAGFILVAITQVVAIIIYHTCKTSREDAAKKFF